ncbi:MAG: asparagine synthase (glutamine-hydrolyzing) [Candidatus Omnitrophota bacterium]
MCGIVGFINSKRLASVEAVGILQKMADEINYRGPDDDGYFADATMCLGMKRLSIIDLKSGHQPMFTDSGSIVIVYNGEVYNFKELRVELEAKGTCFRTTSDTEVVLKMYEHYGIDSFTRLNGMFALAVYDKLSQKLVLCRDPIGIKPLYYFWDGYSFMFASEIKAILKHPMAASRKVNLSAVWDYLTYEYVPAPKTIFDNIYKLLPGHFIEINLKDLAFNVVKYWDFPLTHNDNISEEECNERFGSLFVDAVNRQMVADVPVGIFLSGGLDSSAVTLVASQLSATRIKTFCVGFEEGTLTDEAAYAREVAGFLGTDHKEFIANSKEFFKFIPEFVYLMDEPNADMATIGKYFACKLASEHVKVVLSGDGGDEMLCGYRFNEAMQRMREQECLQKLPRKLVKDSPLSLFKLMGREDLYRRWERMFIPLRQRGQFALPSMTKRFTENDKKELFKEIPSGVRDSLKILSEDFKKAETLDPLTQIQYAWSKQWLAEHLLMEADRMSMAVSLELRVPFLDVELVKFLFSVPDKLKVRKVKGRYQTKYLLRQFLKGRVPRSVLTRPKRGFQVPNIRFVRNDLASHISDVLLDSDSRVAALMNRDVVMQWIKRSYSDAYGMAYQKVWILYILEIWLRQWCQ